jgi:hypothetical protein
LEPNPVAMTTHRRVHQLRTGATLDHRADAGVIHLKRAAGVSQAVVGPKLAGLVGEAGDVGDAV